MGLQPLLIGRNGPPFYLLYFHITVRRASSCVPLVYPSSLQVRSDRFPRYGICLELLLQSLFSKSVGAQMDYLGVRRHSGGLEFRLQGSESINAGRECRLAMPCQAPVEPVVGYCVHHG